MKFSAALIALALQVTGVVSGRTPEEHAALVEKCGDLGVMEVPEGADPANYRDCAGHPLGHPTKSDVAEMKGGDMFVLACAKTNGGCDKGYCWKKCGLAGEWCWTAGADGGGAWLTCKKNSDCSNQAPCGKNCKPGDNSCGCSC